MTKKLKELTAEQEDLISVVWGEWLDPLPGPDGPAPLDKEKCKNGVEWLYQLIGLEKPIIFFMSSPFGCQLAANILKKSNFTSQHEYFNQVEGEIVEKIKIEIHDQTQKLFETKVHSSVYNRIEKEILEQINHFNLWAYGYINHVYNQVRNWNSVRNQIQDQIWDQIKNQASKMIKKQVKEQLWIWIHHEVGYQIANKIRPSGLPLEIYLENEINKSENDKLEYFRPSWPNFIFNADFGALYDYWTRIGIINDENVNRYIEYLKSYLGYVIFLQDFAFVCGLPRKIHRDVEGRLHCESGPSLSWEDGYSQYYWHGISVPSKWIDEPLSITSKDFLSIDNAEQRRILHEILGTERLTEILDLEVIDTKKVPFQTWDREAFLRACQTGELGEDMRNFTKDKILSEPEKIVPYYDLFVKSDVQTITLLETVDSADGLRKAQFIRVECPSTGEIFYLGVPNDFTDAAEARAWTLYEGEKSGGFET